MRVLFALLLALWLGQVSPLHAEQVVSDGIAVIVDETIITLQDVDQMSGQAIDLLIRELRSKPEELRQRVLATRADATEQLIERQLILQDYKTAGYNFPESIIEDTIQDRLKQRYRDRVTLMQTLREQGVTYETYRMRTREEIIIEAMRRKNLGQDILISPQKILNFYGLHKTNYALGDQVKLRRIVLNKPQSDTGGTRQMANEILGKLAEGAQFPQMANNYSDLRETETSWEQTSALKAEVADAIASLKPGQRTGVIDLKESCLIVLVEDKRPAHVRPLSDLRDEIERTLKQVESERLRKKWIARLKEKSFVRYF